MRGTAGGVAIPVGTMGRMGTSGNKEGSARRGTAGDFFVLTREQILAMAEAVGPSPVEGGGRGRDRSR